MRHDGLQPNVITFSALISACSQGQQWQRVLAFREEMRRLSVAAVHAVSRASGGRTYSCYCRCTKC